MRLIVNSMPLGTPIPQKFDAMELVRLHPGGAGTRRPLKRRTEMAVSVRKSKQLVSISAPFD